MSASGTHGVAEPAPNGDTECDGCGVRFDIVPDCVCRHCHATLGGGDYCACDTEACPERADGLRHVFGTAP